MGGKKSFSTRLSQNVLLVVSIIFVIVLLIVAVSSHQLIADEATSATESTLHSAISDMNLTLGQVEISTQAVATNLVAVHGNEDAMAMICREVVRKSDLIDGCSVAYVDDAGKWHLSLCMMGLNGQQFERHLDESTYDIQGSEWFTYARDLGKPYWSEPFLDTTYMGIRHSAYSYPIFDKANNLIAVVNMEVPVDWLEDRIAQIRPYAHSNVILRCSDSCFIGLDEEEFFSAREMMSEIRGAKSIDECMKAGKDSMGRFSYKSNVSFVVYGPLSNGWSLAIICPYRDVLYRSTQMHLILIYICIIGLVVIYVACYRRIRSLTRPITELSVSALNMGKGNFKAQLPTIESKDEMLRLRNAFSYLQDSLQEYISELKNTTSANERMEGELNVARNIQMGMLSTDFPEMLSAKLVPAKEVGGDLYDFSHREDRLYFAVGDVSGKGVPASLMMAITRSSLRFLSGIGHPMEQAMTRINRSVVDANSNDMFVTLFIARLDLHTLMMDYCNAGHNPIIVVPPAGDAYYLHAKANLAVGLFPDFPYQGESLQLEAGTRLILYTDGVSEAETATKELFGEERLLAWASSDFVRDLNHSDQQVVDSLFDTVKAFTQDNEQNDDITIMSITIPSPIDSRV